MKILTIIFLTILLSFQIILSYFVYENNVSIVNLNKEIIKNKQDIDNYIKLNEGQAQNSKNANLNYINNMPALDEKPKTKLTPDEISNIEAVISSELNSKNNIENARQMSPSDALIRQLN